MASYVWPSHGRVMNSFPHIISRYSDQPVDTTTFIYQPTSRSIRPPLFTSWPDGHYDHLYLPADQPVNTTTFICQLTRRSIRPPYLPADQPVNTTTFIYMSKNPSCAKWTLDVAEASAQDSMGSKGTNLKDKSSWFLLWFLLKLSSCAVRSGKGD